MANEIVTPKFRAAFVALVRPSAPPNNPEAEKKFSVRAVFMPDANIEDMKKAAQAVAVAKWGDKVPKTLRSPFRTNEELDTPIPGIPDDAIVMTFSAKEGQFSPAINLVDSDNNQVDETEVYAGRWMLAQVRPFAYENAGNRGISFALLNVQLRDNDEPLGKGRIPASKAFEAVGGGGAKTAGGLFD